MALSVRGRKALNPALPYFDMFFKGMENLWEPQNPKGFVLLCVAENRLAFPLFALDRLIMDDVRGSISPETAAYCDMRGRQSFRCAFAAMISRTVLHGVKIDPDHLIVSSGCGALINHLAILLCEQGDAVLIPTPTYGALYNDFCVLAQTVVVDVPTDAENRFVPTEEGLELAFQEASIGRGLKCRLLFLINPHNPTGTVHTREELLVSIRWARKRSLHVVIDEIYANSVWDSSIPFESVVNMLADDAIDMRMGDDIHVLWGLSKDFGMGGYRTGVLYTRNEQLFAAFGNINYFTTVSNDTQDCIAALLSDDNWVDLYLTESRRLLRASYTALTSILSEAGIPFVPATSGMFVWLDLRHLLPESVLESSDKFASEKALTRILFEEWKILFTPGEAQHAPEPGFYRVCYAYMPIEAVTEAFSRLATFAKQYRDGKL